LPSDPCNPSPCGSNGQCRVIGKVASCVYPECIINQDCPRDKACFTQKCQDPCRDVCGLNAICQVVNHNALCSCPPGYYGEPKQQCIIQRTPGKKIKPNIIYYYFIITFEKILNFIFTQKNRNNM